MADTTTTNYGLTKPEVGGSTDTWGTKINGVIDDLDQLLGGDTAVTGIDINSGSIDGTTIGGSSAAAGTFSNLTATGTTTLAGATTSADINFGDNDKAVFGAGSDLQIYHEGSNSFISDQGTGDLKLLANNLLLNNAADSENYINCVANGAVSLYYNGGIKLDTTSGGVSVNGSMYASGNIGLDSTDFISFTGNTRMDITVNGSNEFRFESDGDFHADGDVIAYSTTTASDERLKENIEVVSDAVEKCEALRGVTFDWKRDGSASAGVIAQEVQQVLPEAVKQVTGMNGEDHLTVNYGALTSILIEAVKELSARVEELEAK